MAMTRKGTRKKKETFGADLFCEGFAQDQFATLLGFASYDLVLFFESQQTNGYFQVTIWAQEDLLVLLL